ncbi:hypothetical protein BN2127_JRS2_03897 [Bacillus subtilis]|nr:hypothetical protein BN2127_JRS2_03897 [Bacillus subtilis]
MGGSSGRKCRTVFCIPASGYDTTFADKWLSKAWFLGQCFGTSINHLVSDLFIFSPRRDKAPSKLAQTVIGGEIHLQVRIDLC